MIHNTTSRNDYNNLLSSTLGDEVVLDLQCPSGLYCYLFQPIITTSRTKMKKKRRTIARSHIWLTGSNVRFSTRVAEEISESLCTFYFLQFLLTLSSCRRYEWVPTIHGWIKNDRPSNEYSSNSGVMSGRTTCIVQAALRTCLQIGKRVFLALNLGERGLIENSCSTTE